MERNPGATGFLGKTPHVFGAIGPFLWIECGKMVDETTDVCGWNIRLWAQVTNYDGTQTLWYLKGKPIWSSIFLWFHVKFRTVYSRQSDCHTLYEVLDRSKNLKDPHFGGVDLWNVGLLSDRGIISFSRNNHGPDVAWWTGWSSWPNPGAAKPQNQNHQPTVGLLLFYTHDVLMIYTILVRCSAHFPTIDGCVWKWGFNPQWNSHLVGKMISKTIGFRGTLFSDKPIDPPKIQNYPPPPASGNVPCGCWATAALWFAEMLRWAYWKRQTGSVF